MNVNVNPHIQYLQSHQLQQQGQQQVNSSGQSPQVSQLQLQQQHLQRQQLLNHHLQQQQQQQQQQSQQQQSQQLGTPNAQNVSINPLLAALNGSNATASHTVSVPGNGVNLLQMQFNQSQQQQSQPQSQQHALQFQQLQQQQQQQLQSHQVPTQHIPDQVPLVKEVWNQNLEYEFHSLRTFINDNSSDIYIAIHQEIPGIVARPVGSFKSPSDYHFQTLRTNADLLNLIQLSFCVTKIKENEISSSAVWQFNFLYDPEKEMFNEEHLHMLQQTSQINFSLHQTQGIPHFSFAELLIESGLLMDSNINWVSYHAGYDLGFFVSLLLNESLPMDEQEFYWFSSKYFPSFYDLKYIGSQILNKPTNDDNSKNNNKPSIEYLAEELHLLPISPAIRQHFASSSSPLPGHQQQMTSTLNAYLSMECFKELLRQSSFDSSFFSRFKGYIWGLGHLSGNGNGTTIVGADDNIIPNGGTPQPSTPGGSNKGGTVHFGRPL
ncbi:ribonuclease H-like domain-containing protein [Scheffersomyces amazonensis]|uniref:ribonuclease H-like domain-containing protein n=1 Tax=Scheffersomyces amazonensis TaxID=1078765 RepID=UPI00315D94A8